jgi:hypothetical protein
MNTTGGDGMAFGAGRAVFGPLLANIATFSTL